MKVSEKRLSLDELEAVLLGSPLVSLGRACLLETPRRQEIADDWRGKVQQRRLTQVSFVHIARLPSVRVAGTITACSSYRVKG